MALDFGEHILKGQLIVVSKDANGNKVVRTVGPVDKDGKIIKKERVIVPVKKKRMTIEEQNSYMGLTDLPINLNRR